MEFSQALARTQLRKNIGRPIQRPLRWQVKSTIEFAVDKDCEATYYHHARQEDKLYDPITREPVEDRMRLQNPWDRLAVTPESYLHAHYGRGFGLLPELKNRRDLHGRPLAYRDPRNEGEDPLKDYRVYTFFFTFEDREWCWEVLRRKIGMLRGEDAQWTEYARTAMNVFVAQGDQGNWYKYQREYSSPDGQYVFRRMLFSPAAGYLPIEDLNEGRGPADKTNRVLRHRIWQYRPFDAVYVPSYFKELKGGTESGPEVEEWKLVQCEVNKPVAPAQFTWAGMDLPEGTVVMDRVDNVAYLWEGGQLKTVAQLSPPAGMRGWTAWLRWVLAGLTLATVAAILLVAWHRRQHRREAPAG
jgi:hypothetical protein